MTSPRPGATAAGAAIATGTALPGASELPAGVWPLGLSQRALWFLNTFQPDSSFYVICMGLRMRGPLDLAALRAAWDECVARQDALRTRFISLDGFPYQVFMPGQRMELPLQDVSGLGPDAAEEYVQGRCDLAAQAPFDLAAEFPVRAELIRLAADHHVLVMSVHHIVFDGWSAQVLLTEMANAYAAFAAGQAPRLAPLELTMGEHAARQAARFASGTAERAAEAKHWRQVLAGAQFLELPAERVRPQVRTFAGATLSRDIDAGATAAVRALARAHGTTAFTILATVFSLALAELTGQQDIVYGVPLAGRLDDESASLIGFLVNVLPLRVDLAGARTFAEALRRHQQPVLDLLTHQEFPFTVLVDELQPERSGNRNPYFDICFQYLQSPEVGLAFGDARLDLMDARRPSSQFDLSCDVHDRGEFLTIALEYSTEVFGEATARLVHAMIEATLAAAIADPGAPLRIGGQRMVPLLAKEPMAAQWRPGGLRGLVAGWAGKRPGAPAVICGPDSIAYGELDAAATRLAARLAEAGVRPGDRVGLLLEPTADLPIAILAVLECGAAYVPVDPRFPAARAAAMLERAAARVVLAHQPTLEKAAALDARLVEVTASDREPSPAAQPPPPAPARPADAAYVIFTSGSTGQPKAVAVQQSAALTLAAAAAATYELVEADRVLQMAAAAVDVSVEEFFGAWFAGACAVMHNAETQDLEEVILRHRASVLNLPASRWHEWTRDLAARSASVPECVRLVIAGSERVEPARVADWRALPGRSVRLLNAYGTTEACVSSAWYDTARLPRDATCTENVPIGGPLPHARLYVLDGAGRLVPPGAPGELHIGGPGVGLGYLGDGPATAERFLPDPFGSEPGGRMYRTGDRVRQLPTGELDFLGRADTQVKVRGSRIDLAEVERAGAGAPGVTGFVADVRGDEHGARLVGYLTVADGADQQMEEARVAEWRVIHDESDYHEAAPGQADFNTSGWISSYTQEAIPEPDMKEWLDATVERILRRPPGRVLEIGCGTGMILLRVAPVAERYVGTDIAPGALAYVRDQLAAAGLDDGRVRLAEAQAADFGALGDEQFDLVIINSVSQYFPDLAYLQRVLDGAWRRLRPGGRVFVGDVRDVTTLRAFHLSVLLSRPGAADDPAALAGEVARLADAESELCVAPGWFAQLAQALPGAAAVTEVKRGRAGTEMNRFRYDVSIWRDLPAATTTPRRARRGPVTLAALRSLLDGPERTGIDLTEVPDARTYRDVTLARQLAEEPGSATLGPGEPPGAGDDLPHPDDLADAARALGYAATVSPDGAGLLTLFLTPAGLDGQGPIISREAAPLALAANEPMRAARERAAIAAVRERLAGVLPPAMVPSRFVVVGSFPLTISGKIDRPRLPDPGRVIGEPSQVGARTATQRALCDIWADALGLASVGIRDNFFEIGGDSISWLRIMSRCIRAGYPVGARDVFLHQSVEQLAQWLDDAPQRAAGAARAAAERPESTELAPIQRWFFEAFGQGRDHQNQYQWYELAAGCAAEVIQRAVRAVAEHHDVLLSRFAHVAGGWRQLWPQDPERLPCPVREVDMTRLPEAERASLLRRETDMAQASLRITDGPLFAVVVFRTAAGEPDLVFWCVHHLVVDAVSWQPLSEDLETAIEALAAGREPDFPAASADAAAWAAWSQLEAGRLSDDELAYWRSTAAAPAFALPVIHPGASALARDGHFVTRSVPLPQVPDRAGSAMLAACLAGVHRVLADLTGNRAGTVWLEFHGRPLSPDAPELARAVGWFTALFPFLLIDDAAGAGSRGRLDAIPHGGVGYGRARYLRGENLETAANVSVNYLGPARPAAGSLLRPAAGHADSAGPAGSPESQMPYAAEISIGLEEDGSLTVTASLCARNFDEAAAGKFTDQLVASIGASITAPSDVVAEDGFDLLPDSVQASDYAAALRARPDVVAACALSPAQRAMLYRHLLDPAGDVNYNDFVLELSGTADPGLFSAAWQALAQRHEVLRTSFEWEQCREPIQVVHAAAPAIRFLDLSGVPADAADERVRQLLLDGRANPPRLNGSPPFRLTLVTLAADRHRLVWIDHHILLDGWSSGILAEELTAAYAALARDGRPFADRGAPVRYRDYLAWLRQQPSDQASAYWREALAGFRGPTALPLDAQPSLSLSAAGDFHEVELELGTATRAGLRALAERHRVTAGALYYAAWAAFLARYSGQPLVTFGVAQSGRPAALGNVSAMVGMYMSTLPLALRVDVGQRFEDLLGEVSEEGWKLLAIAGSGSLWDVYDWAQIPSSRTLFHSVVVVQNFAAAIADTPGLPVRAELAHAQTASGFPLTLAVDPEGGVMRLVGDGRCLAEAASRQLLATFGELVDMVVADPASRVGDLPSPPTPARQGRAAEPLGELDPPRGEREERIARAWCSVLGIGQVSRTVNLFDTGATSLTAARLHAALCAEFGRELPITDLFRYPTVASMAAALASGEQAGDGARAEDRSGRMSRRRDALRAGPARRARREHDDEDVS